MRYVVFCFEFRGRGASITDRSCLFTATSRVRVVSSSLATFPSGYC